MYAVADCEWNVPGCYFVSCHFLGNPRSGECVDSFPVGHHVSDSYWSQLVRSQDILALLPTPPPTFCPSTKPHTNIRTGFQEHQLGNHCHFKGNIAGLINLGKDSWKQIPWRNSINELTNHNKYQLLTQLWCPSSLHGLWWGLLWVLQTETNWCWILWIGYRFRSFPQPVAPWNSPRPGEDCTALQRNGEKAEPSYRCFHLWNGNLKKETAVCGGKYTNGLHLR